MSGHRQLFMIPFQVCPRRKYSYKLSIILTNIAFVCLYLPVGNSKSVTADETKKSQESSQSLAEIPRPITMFLLLRDMRELENDAVPGLSPCWDHVIYIVQSRDIPLDPKDVRTYISLL